MRGFVRDMSEYTARVIRCAITSLQRHGRFSEASWQAELDLVRRWIVDGIELIQVREKHLEGASLFAFTEQVMQQARGSSTSVLVNGRLDVAVACDAQGVHLTTAEGSLRPGQVREGFAKAGLAPPLVSVSCHSLPEIKDAVLEGANLILFGPVFEKRVEADVVKGGVGLTELRAAVVAAGDVPVLALGGITDDRVAGCLAAGAVGVAAIRLFARRP